MVSASAGCAGDGCGCAEGSAARELVECAGYVRGGVLIEEMCDAGLSGCTLLLLLGWRGWRRCGGVEIGRSRGGVGGLCRGGEGLELGLCLPAWKIKVVVGVGHVGEFRFRHGRRMSSRFRVGSFTTNKQHYRLLC